MAKNLGARCRLCRAEGAKLYLKGDRCYNQAKCAFVKRPGKPGKAPMARFSKLSNYGIQLREKQKLRRYYDVMETQFRSYYDKACHMHGITGENMLQLLERRFTNVILKACFGNSIRESRQIIRHKHFLVNGRRCDIPSFIVSEGDVIEIKPGSKAAALIKTTLENSAGKTIPSWLEVDKEKLIIKVVGVPQRSDVGIEINERLVVEYYSR